MKIVLTGGGTGGHFYPLIAVAERIHDYVVERRLIEPELLYLGPEPFDIDALAEQDITHLHAPAGKLRRHASMVSILDFLKTSVGIVRALSQLFSLYPDVIFSSGGYAAFPTLVAARILNISVVVYDADAEPGIVSLWSSKFARWIAVAHPDAAQKFPKKVQERIANVGHPIRKEIEAPTDEGGHQFLKLDPSVPTIFVLGGSQGAQAINDALVDTLPVLVEKYNIVHQTGRKNLEEITGMSKLILQGSRYDNRYRVFGLLNVLALRMAAGVSDLIISRAGSGTIFEIASWGIPAILIPIPQDVSHDQIKNAFSYARSGAAIVIEQQNLTPHVLVAEINRIMDDKAQQEAMKEGARSFARRDAAKKIAKAVVDIGLEHTS
ncbi:UDP-N-acetylglucosamine--N-acetylmuramyl-(pentapeptide) pyrophosphoryl-undecaprenol N-acetylglucosamine transferase [Candidatus Kaiserbacteria bacterium]|nr:UDP-N-acetylglucosamine--N-acetylmuramyl-(pentapeptide) pyrophosphoryl-undecaprenol N-acetylglucosamine transferase [Candidatus Kaiserbacteria bacterium]